MSSRCGSGYRCLLLGKDGTRLAEGAEPTPSILILLLQVGFATPSCREQLLDRWSCAWAADPTGAISEMLASIPSRGKKLSQA